MTQQWCGAGVAVDMPGGPRRTAISRSAWWRLRSSRLSPSRTPATLAVRCTARPIGARPLVGDVFCERAGGGDDAMRVGILDVLALPTRHLTTTFYRLLLTKQFASVTPQAISV